MSSHHPDPANRLAKEKSPYLLQHAQNPVDWYPWSEEAFEKAKREGKMIFLSIGYSTCNWCHVMEHESFENREIAALLNRHFVSIKVDREERPDIDQIYMTAIQTMTGSGGWPLTAFLTPEGKPVTGGTYFPPEDKWGRMGMKTLLPRLAQMWEEKRREMETAGEQLAGILQSQPSPSSPMILSEEIFTVAHGQFAASFDPEHGGFGKAPKFPRPHDLSFLLRYWKRTSGARELEMVKTTLNQMAHGGIYDHLGGGFHRYSTDEAWLVPHFEKMLYDQALLARTYLEAYQAARIPEYADVARDIFNYVQRDMTAPEGGFYSAEDADSEGEEGKFYVWRPEEIQKILGEEDGKIFNEFYGITDAGNFEHGMSILHLTQRIPEFAAQKGIPVEELKRKLVEGRRKLFESRRKRIPPHKDDKILTAWNGLMISALALGAQILDEPSYSASAGRAADFILTSLQRGGRLWRRFRQGEAAVPAFQEDYAFFALGLLDLYQATFEIKWFEEAKRLTEDMIRFFWDEKAGGFFYTASDSEPLIARMKEYYDGAVPSGNSIAALLLLRLSHMTGGSSLRETAEKIFHSNAQALEKYPMAFPQFLIAVDFALGPAREIVLAGKKDSPDFQNYLRLLRSRFEPRQVVLHHPEDETAGRIENLAGFIKDQIAPAGRTAVYVCRNRTCRRPAATLQELEKILS